MKTEPRSTRTARTWHERHKNITHKQLSVMLPLETYNRLNAMRGEKSWPKFLGEIK